MIKYKPFLTFYFHILTQKSSSLEFRGIIVSTFDAAQETLCAQAYNVWTEQRVRSWAQAASMQKKIMKTNSFTIGCVFL